MVAGAPARFEFGPVQAAGSAPMDREPPDNPTARPRSIRPRQTRFVRRCPIRSAAGLWGSPPPRRRPLSARVSTVVEGQTRWPARIEPLAGNWLMARLRTGHQLTARKRALTAPTSNAARAATSSSRPVLAEAKAATLPAVNGNQGPQAAGEREGVSTPWRATRALRTAARRVPAGPAEPGRRAWAAAERRRAPGNGA